MRIRLIRITGICVAPQYVADDLLRAEGFLDVEYVPAIAGIAAAKAVGSGAADITMNFVAPTLMRVDAGDAVQLLAGVHVGCFELFGTDRVRAIRDLKGKTVAVQALESSQHIYLASMAAYVGLDPRKDIKWAIHPSAEAMQLLAEGKIDAFLGFAPDPQELRARKIGHVVVNSAVDRPWAQYFCCIAAGNRDFVRKHPVATKRALRAILKAADLCALEPDRAARAVVDKGYAKSYDYAPDDEGTALRQVAGLRPGGHHPLLRSPPPRSRDDRGNPTEAHHSRRRLAVSERVEEGTEGIAATARETQE
jgi:NitT/TauT family transport system substrate-binding protein